MSLFIANYGSKFEEKRKDRESNGVCRKNEKDNGKSMSSVNKSTERNEVVSE